MNTCFATATFSFEGQVTDFSSAADSGNIMHRRFCTVCGTPMFSQAESRPHLIFVRVGTLDNPDSVKPVASIWVSKAPTWASIDTRIPQIEAQPPAPATPPPG